MLSTNHRAYVALLLLLIPSPVTVAVEFMTPLGPESAVTSTEAYFVGQFGPTGGSILKYDLEGNQDEAFTSPEFPFVRGIAINDAGNTLWVAHDGGVTELTIEDTGLTLVQVHNVSSVMAEPNGLCLAPDEAHLYVASPGSANLIQFDLATNDWSVLLEEDADAPDTVFRPNGCVVSSDSDQVWMVHRSGTITHYTLSTGDQEFYLSEGLTGGDLQTVGDGLTLWGTTLFVSVWVLAPPANGTIFECDATAPGSCREWAALMGADLQVDLKTDPSQPQLIIPQLPFQKVITMPLLEGADKDTDGNGNVTEAPGDGDTASPGATTAPTQPSAAVHAGVTVSLGILMALASASSVL